MSSSQLQQAVELANAGQREQAAALLRQIVQNDPANEVAWLWLASVAADRAEYERALNSVLRLNPANQQAQRALTELFASPPPVQPVAPVSPPVRPVSEPPPSEPRYMIPERRYTPPPSAPRRRGCGCFPLSGCLGCGGGCGCIQGCLIGVLVLVVIPVIVFLALSHGDASLGPLDWPGAQLPGSFGRKTVEFQTAEYDVTLEVPRSWYAADDTNGMWTFWRDILDNELTFADSTTWDKFEDQTGTGVTTVSETEPFTMSIAHDWIGVQFVDTVSGEFTCAAVRASADTHDGITEYSGGLCGYEDDVTQPPPAARVFANQEIPGARREITFVVPVSAETASRWRVSVPDKVYDHFRSDVRQMIDTAQITLRAQ